MGYTSGMSAKKTLLNISPAAWEHPADRAALVALKQVPGLDQFVAFFINITTERSFRLQYLSSSVRVGDRQFPRLKTILDEAVATLDSPKRPELYVSNSPALNAMAIGADDPFIVLNSATVEMLDDEELLFVVAHELGHCMSGHALYKTLLIILINLSSSVLASVFPPAKILLYGVVMALLEWDRKSELSADRAGLLAVQAPEVVYRAHMKTAGGGDVGQMNLNEFFLQAQEYEGGDNIVDSFHKLLNTIWLDHPQSVVRLVELNKWEKSGAYGKILGGEYPTRQDKQDPAKAFDDAYKTYRDEMKASSDPLTRVASGLGDMFDKAKTDIEQFFKGVFPGGPGSDVQGGNGRESNEG